MAYLKMNSKKILIGLIMLSLIVIAFLGGYIISRGGLPDTDSAGTGNMLSRFDDKSLEATADTLGPSSDRIAITRKINSIAPSKDNNSILYYEKATGHVFELNLSTKKELPLSLANLPNFLSTVWSPTQKEVISLFYEPAGNAYKYFNYKTKKSTLLTEGIRSVAFSPDGKNLTYFLVGDELNYIYISSPDGSGAKRILSTRMSSVSLAWPKADLIILKSVDENTGSTNLLGINTKGEISSILNNVSELSELWSKDGKRMIYSQAGESQPLLRIIDIETGVMSSVELSLRPSDCAWSMDSRTVYCIGAKDPGDPNQRLYKINAEDGKPIDVKPVPGHISPREAHLSLLEDYLIVLNDIDERLYLVETAE
ncbi:MAG: hypothetical protein UW46_C0002G0041 [Candidatus Yanofskybacteria bacterium GW2011_GWF1_44_227]|uniref:Protein TolB n=1 Tax=Candidatus Yanofskybacteria bacterium GW2011_GWE2_40_11 TaxID=1619033 RepID=A0A0G0QJW5_9BACT|nr:MAG: hypothetical protein UT69_C0004G0015 [Candidatus Yanofskybacteria bacterium GW2011_GWE1_40_10]KKR40644.1 MAG: hypothetical protein UT75_C0006G0023 [Candidatus Yanofskybacteria bacterium GW2011_GWE2_40_11]KKT15795.1 MAG: hypothetical protein UV97_C0002G0041 [Candidatus Yanofskybacteria bacterium GW2011_GWF2_43_596]KKT53485.1 MAG: hypothetical protein UW46_C0002G0041 [Candidatus Yanofskybacteria bacterium GW2011_GWF1_44_227]OGN35891.1 MAG: hypothetical protein A2241_03895 [Candidatus Yano